ncbi:uridylate kinase [Spirochaetia bacterium]|nr:uridylate kinase [Spirochaetia bacterium]
MITVISLGGSIVAPDGVDEAFLKDLVSLVGRLLEEDEKRRFIFVVGGGGPARAWQNAYRNVLSRPQTEIPPYNVLSRPQTEIPPYNVARKIVNDDADWIGIMATRLNAQLVKAVMGEWCRETVVTDPTQVDPLVGRVLVAAGWKPGFSSDYDAVVLAERFQAAMVINLSNIDQVYTDDPRKNPDAKPIDAISWADFRAMMGDEWVPGKNVPFDPIASRHAAKIGLKVICAAGKDLPNLEKILNGEPFLGTTIG